jgi:F-type H+-transporting ATPase subunit a
MAGSAQGGFGFCLRNVMFRHRYFFQLGLFFICGNVFLPAFAAAAETGSEQGVPITAEPPISTLPYLTNSILVAGICTVILLVLARNATRKMELVPRKTQNIFEALVEGLYETLEAIVGKHMIARTFSLLATIFIFILTANWFGLLPGVGTIGFGERIGPLASAHVSHPLLRPASADLNMTLSIAALFMCLWIYWTVTETGPIQFLKHTFGPKGGLTGLLKALLIPIFIFVGLIEVISIAFRLVSLSMRLYGNIFAGENLLHAMGSLGDKLPGILAPLSSVLLPLPFYFLELLVGLIQAFVFMLLCAVYVQLSTTHEEEGAVEGH